MSEALRNQPERTLNGPEIRTIRTGIVGHFYWLSEKGGRTERTDLGLRSSINARAVAVDYWDRKAKGENPQVFADLSHLWGEAEPTEGSLVGERWHNRYHIPQQDIVIREDAWSTWGEVKAVAEESKRRGWTKVVDVAFKPHRRLTIPWIFGKFRLQPEYQTPEQVLEQKDIHRFRRTYPVRKVLDVDRDGNPTPWKQVPPAERQYEETGETVVFSHEHNHTKRLVDRLSRHKFGFMYWVYEGMKWTMMHKPGFNYEDLEKSNRESRGGKGTDSPISRRLGRWFDFDVYTLNGAPSPFSRKKRA
jgi:hypothetical protein